MDDIIRLLELHRGSSNLYGAKGAFIRILEWADFDEAIRLFTREQELNQDERVLEAVARKAAKHDSLSRLNLALNGLKGSRRKKALGVAGGEAKPSFVITAS